jgi:hypothetical protein
MKKAEKEAMYDNIQRHGEALLELFPEARERRPIELCKSLRRLERKASYLRNSPDKYDGWLKVKRSVERILGADRCQYYGLFIEHNEERGPYMLKLENKTRFSQLPTDAWGCGLVAPDFSPDQQWTNQGRGREAWPVPPPPPRRVPNPAQQRIDEFRAAHSVTIGPGRPAFTAADDSARLQRCLGEVTQALQALGINPSPQQEIVQPENIIGTSVPYSRREWFRYDENTQQWVINRQGEDQ